MTNIINPIEAKIERYNKKLTELSVHAKEQVRLNVTNPVGPFASIFIDWMSIYENTQELSAKEFFLEYVGAVDKKDRLLLDEFVTSFLKISGIITEIVEEEVVELTEVDLPYSNFSKQAQIYIPYSYYVDNKEMHLKDRYKLTIDELYFKYKKLLSENEYFVRAYADSATKSHDFLDNHDVTTPYAYLIIQKLVNGNYLIMNNPRA